MKLALQTFEAGLGSLKDYLCSTESESKLLALLARKDNAALNPEEQELIASIGAAHVGRKQYIYTVVIVTLYGLLERYVDSVIERHVQGLAIVAPTYRSLPKAIVERHVTRSMDLVRALAEDKKFRGGLTEAQVVENLHLCLSGVASFRLNGAAFALHRGNLTLVKISEFLMEVGIDHHLRRVSITDPMLKCFEMLYPGRDIQKVADPDLHALFDPINSLVDRRNEVSHGAMNIEDLESAGLLMDRCEFVSAYVHGLHSVFLQETVRAYFSSPKAALQLGTPIAVYDDSIVCFEIASGEVAVGDLLIAHTGYTMEPFRFGPIERIEINHKVQASISVNAATKFATKVGFRAREQYEYCLVRDPEIF